MSECLEGDKKFQLRIYVQINDKSRSMKLVYENMDLKPGKVIFDLHNVLKNLFTQKLQFCHHLSPLHSNKVKFFSVTEKKMIRMCLNSFSIVKEDACFFLNANTEKKTI